jgi:polyisoprenoid-binding protein YceI
MRGLFVSKGFKKAHPVLTLILTLVTLSPDKIHGGLLAIVMIPVLPALYHCIVNSNKTRKTMNLVTKRRTTAGLVTLAIALASLAVQGQDRYVQSGTSTISIAGTSTLHEWTMTSKEVSYDAMFETNSQGDPVRISSLLVSLPAESLKSEKTAMDKNAYKALKTDAHKQIAFQLVSSKLDGKTIHCSGKLKIAGATKPVDMEVVYTLLPGGALKCKGSKKLVMTDYGVEPPSFMFGSVTTGDEITVTFEVTLAPVKQPVTLN